MDFKQPPRRPTAGSPPSKPIEPPTSSSVPIGATSDSMASKPVNDDTTSISTEAKDKSTATGEDLHITPSPSKRSKKKALIILLLLVLVLAGLIAAYWWFIIKPKSQPTVAATTTSETTKKEVAKAKPTSPLTGVELVNESLASRPVTGIMIENSPDSRPQSGLNEAGVVYEAIAEGGITRFLALYQEATPNYIGPVRSARPYYIDFLLPYDASYAHVGGSPAAMTDIKTLGVKDLDQFYNAGAYVRITERYAPHNVYTGFDKLDALNTSKGYTTSKFTGFTRKRDVAQTPTASSIDFSISSPLYSPHFEYDATTNSYKRFQGGEAHIDQKSGKQLTPKTVIAVVTPKSYDPDGTHTAYETTGSGKIYVFQDGIVSEGTWQKTDRKSQYVFTDKNGLPMKLNAGQTWISLVANQSDVTFKP